MTYNLQLTEQEVQIVVAALAELRLKDGLNVYLSIKNQIEAKKEKE